MCAVALANSIGQRISKDMIIGISGGTIYAGTALYVKGINASGLSTASIAFCLGGESFLGAIKTVNDNNLTLREKISVAAIPLLLGSATGVATNYFITPLFPEFSLVRAAIVTFFGAKIAHAANNLPLEYYVTASCLGSAGRSIFVSGAVLSVGSALRILGVV